MTSINHVGRRAQWAVAVPLLVLLGIVSIGIAGIAVGPSPAGAHARIEGTSPADASEIEALPDRVTITFAAKPATVEGDPLRVYDPAGMRVDDGDVRVARGGEVLSVGLAPGAARPGRYEVAYHVVSADSHLLAGRFGFAVIGAGGGAGAGVEPGADPAADAEAHPGAHPRADPAIGTAVSVDPSTFAPHAPDRRVRPSGTADLRPELLATAVAGVIAALRLRRWRAARRMRPRRPAA